MRRSYTFITFIDLLSFNQKQCHMDEYSITVLGESSFGCMPAYKIKKISLLMDSFGVLTSE